MILYKKAQISIEYLILIGFITFSVIGILLIASVYAGQIEQTIRSNQLERFAEKITSSARIVFYAGSPSKTTITAYLPKGTEQIRILDKEIVFNVSTEGGMSIISYSSDVPLVGEISIIDGVKKISLDAEDNQVSIVETS